MNIVVLSYKQKPVECITINGGLPEQFTKEQIEKKVVASYCQEYNQSPDFWSARLFSVTKSLKVNKNE